MEWHGPLGRVAPDLGNSNNRHVLQRSQVRDFFHLRLDERGCRIEAAAIEDGVAPLEAIELLRAHVDRLSLERLTGLAFKL